MAEQKEIANAVQTLYEKCEEILCQKDSCRSWQNANCTATCCDWKFVEQYIMDFNQTILGTRKVNQK